MKTKKGEIYKSITVDLPELFPVECTGDKTPGIMALNAEVCNKIWTKRWCILGNDLKLITKYLTLRYDKKQWR